ncbi:hypothetical protein HBHAL_1658 [Halobacillus halophilus DSM 2266]|uniref:Uncharacterized protein n=1 Tax=Halobacillus halophilus (strain ATCC 35676 / DSM 2266 / JCM 20832 / KCTC 3685 / LMG 17431 / NBRC 102448 / NCIMB 2269) TaxID=866895 RepID=I0JIQ7_HALH3|nr:hypothetical protein [Halobacillus halophilus]CCG44025.1 hypothetical protein HBHAL_1658 [Halobacillus halophilus DSM 2266]
MPIPNGTPSVCSKKSLWKIEGFEIIGIKQKHEYLETESSSKGQDCGRLSFEIIEEFETFINTKSYEH